MSMFNLFSTSSLASFLSRDGDAVDTVNILSSVATQYLVTAWVRRDETLPSSLTLVCAMHFISRTSYSFNLH
jgi:hypothetical protein